ncbi:hypothetical protein CY34DRAFT_429300 [Suillus luteus UH-Slu-Lm8-n1]|uniref:Uncharacterized protein n=1 Tax=Suillus luteus UH-Slu-Lm8-n1 TaxID=930992 RepID=A0A0D0BHB5_9AGAM|nr:hypothetical protein CY34DRAFT_429300 [Suillus luteus UH-Slu-Lm8-n1]
MLRSFIYCLDMTEFITTWNNRIFRSPLISFVGGDCGWQVNIVRVSFQASMSKIPHQSRTMTISEVPISGDSSRERECHKAM